METIVISDRYEDADFVYKKLFGFNISKVGPLSVGSLKKKESMKTILVRSETGVPLGGMVFEQKSPEELYAAYFWLPESLRGHGLGMKIIDILKNEAVRLHCKKISLYTSSFQAPGFYHKMGFRLTRQEPTPHYPAYTDYHFEWMPEGDNNSFSNDSSKEKL